MNGCGLSVVGYELIIEPTTKKTNIIFYGQRPHFLPPGMLSFFYVWLFGTKSDVMVVAGCYELVHISTGGTNTSRLPKADTHDEMYFDLIDNIQLCK